MGLLQTNPNVAVIFDMDGVMFNTEELRQIGWVEAAKQHGFDIQQEVFRCTLGRKSEEVVRVLEEQLGENFPVEVIRKTRDAAIRNIIEKDGIPIKDGLLELLLNLEKHKVPFIIATSSKTEVTNFQLSSAKLKDRFPHIVNGDEVQQSKPAPDIFIEAAKRISIDPSKCLVLEDSEPGIIAAHRAGMIPIHIKDILEPSPEIIEKAQFLYKSLTEVTELLFGNNEDFIVIDTSAN